MHTMKKPSFVRSACIGLVAVFALAACTSTSASDGGASDGGTGSITYLGLEPSQGLDPNEAFADASKTFMGMFYETLIERDNDGKFVGALAESWNVSDDLRTYTFTLRDGIAFSDGVPITANDVVWSFERMKSGAVLGGPLENLDEVSAVDDKTVELKLKTPDNSFLAVVGAVGSAAILSKAAVEKGGEGYFAKPVSTSGPWSLDAYVPKGYAEFVENPGYFEEPKIDTVRWNFSTDPAGAASAIESGSADVAGVNYADVDRLKTVDGVNISQADALNILFWGWDRTKPPFSDKLVRQAFAWGVDRDGKQKACWYGTGGVSYGGLLRPWDPNYVDLNPYKAASREEALAKAAALLDEAGWVLEGDQRVARGVDGVDDGTPFAVTVPYEASWPAAECHTLVLQENMKELGIAITPEKYDPASYWGDAADGKFQMYHGGAGAVDSADLYRNWFHSGGSLTELTTKLSDGTLDTKIDDARMATDPEVARGIYAELENWQADELPMLAVGNQWAQFAAGPRLVDFQAAVDQDSYSLVRASVKE